MKSGAPIAAPPGRPAGPARWASLGGVLAIASVLRLGAFLALPVAHDEIHVLAYGLTRASLGGGLRDLLFDIPITVSNGITPLWFWIQAVPASLFGATSRAGLRLLPFALGLWGTVLAWRAGRRLHGRRAGWWCGLAWAVTSLMLYTNGRGEFAESLIAPLLLILLLDLSPRSRAGVLPLRALVPPAIILFTYFGKGLLVWGTYAAYLGLHRLLSGRGLLPSRGLTTSRLASLVLLPLLPSVLWLAAAQIAVFGSAGPVVTDIGPAPSVASVVWNLTAGYGSAVKEFMVAGPAEALYLYTHFQVWPILALLVVPGLLGLVRSARSVWSGLRHRKARQVERELAPLVLGLPILGVLLVKGAFSARFHLLYLPFLLPGAAAAVDRWVGALAEGRIRRFVAGGLPAALWLAWSASWLDRYRGRHDWYQFAWVLGLGLLGLALLALSVRRGGAPAARATAGSFLTGLALLSGGLFGLPDWGRRLAWEPELRPSRPAAVDTLPNPDLALARFYVQREIYVERLRASPEPGGLGDEEEASAAVVARARPLLLRTLERHPRDPETLRDLGVALYKYSPDDRQRVLELWREYVGLHPGDGRLRRVLEATGGP